MRVHPCGRRGLNALLAALAMALAPPATRSNDHGGADYALLYSTLGYDLAASKRALVRPTDPTRADDLVPDRSSWRVVSEEGRVVTRGALQALAVTFGLPLYEIDFTALAEPGRYVLEVDLRGASDARGSLATLPFEVRRRLHVTRTLRAISIENAEARRAPPEGGGGYYDCNSRLGETHSHGIFLAGLSHAYARHADELGVADRGRLRRAARVAVDYLLEAQNGETGALPHQHPKRPYHMGLLYGLLTSLRQVVTFDLPGYNAGEYNTQKAAYGLATYMDLLRRDDPEGAATIEPRLRRTISHLRETRELPPELDAVLHYRLFRTSGRTADLEAARRAVDELLAGFDLSEGTRGWYRDVPYFEALHGLLVDDLAGARAIAWRERARGIAQGDYAELVRRNGFRIVPVGGAAEWADQAGPPQSTGSPFLYAASHLTVSATDALLLAEVTGEDALEQIASAHLGWITGLHPGVPARLVTNPPAQGEAPTSASFLIGIDARHVRPWREWYWEPPPGLTTIVNGFSHLDGRPFVYTDERYEPSETFISHDGGWLQAIVRYDAYLTRASKTRP
jgi:hypothetical protein